MSRLPGSFSIDHWADMRMLAGSSDLTARAFRDLQSAASSPAGDAADVDLLVAVAEKSLVDDHRATSAPDATIGPSAPLGRLAASTGRSIEEVTDQIRTCVEGRRDISRRRLLAGLATTFVATACGGSSGPAMTAAEAETTLGTRPPPEGLNVMAIMIDDLNEYVGYLGGYGGAVHTPNLDAMAAESLTFLQHHIAVPICPPSRATLMWGASPRTHGMTTIGGGLDAPEYRAFSEANPASHLPALLAAGGLSTCGGGKLFHDAGRGDHHHVDSWTEGFFPTVHKIVDGQGGPYGTFFSFGELAEGEIHPDEELSDWCSQKLDEFDGSTRFFLAAGLRLPHLGWVTPRRYIDMYPLDEVVLPEVRSDDWEDLGPIGRAILEQRVDAFGKGWYEIVEESGTRAEHLQHYLAAISHTDEMVGRLMNELAAQPYEDETVVFVVSDNGYHHGEHMAMRKLTLANESTRVPFMIRGPRGSGFDPGFVTHPVGSLSFAPTILDAAGVARPPTVEGRSVRHFDPAQHPGLVTSYVMNSVSYFTERWRFTLHYDEEGRLTEGELYDQVADPGEYTNLVSSRA